MAAQTVLKRLGHYESKVDGRMGPGTRKAVSAYAAANGVGDSFLAVSSHIWGRRDWRTEVTDELEAAFYDALDDTLLDAESARVKDMFAYRGKRDNYYVVCASVNAKNGYGAYTGYKPIYVTVTHVYADVYLSSAPWGTELSESFCRYQAIVEAD